MLSDDEFKMILDYFNRPWQGYRKVRKGVKKKIFGSEMKEFIKEENCEKIDCIIET